MGHLFSLGNVHTLQCERSHSEGLSIGLRKHRCIIELLSQAVWFSVMDLASPSLACLLWPASIYLVACHLWSDYLLAVHPTLHILFCDSRAGAALQSPFLLCQQTSLYIRSLGTPRRMWRGRVEEVIYSMLCFWWSLLQFSFSGDYHFSTILYLSGDTPFRRGHQSPLHSLGIFRGTASLRPTWYSGTGHPSLPF